MLAPGLLLLCIDVFLLPPPLILEILFNTVYSKRERNGRTRRFIWWTNRRKITKLWNTNRPTGVNNRHDTDLVTTTSKHCPLHFSFVLLLLFCPVHSDLSHLLWCLWISPSLYPINTIAMNFPLPSVKTNLIRSHILPLTDIVQERRATLYLIINKCHR